VGREIISVSLLSEVRTYDVWDKKNLNFKDVGATLKDTHIFTLSCEVIRRVIFGTLILK